MHAATDAYITCALWSSTDEPLDSYEVSDAAYTRMRDELQAFIETCEERAPAALAWYEETFGAVQFAHDFWLTRNGHGAGFWDRDYSQPGKTHLDTLSSIARSEGECRLYLHAETQEVEIA